MHEVMVKGILSPQNGMNLYRGCSHGCIYCDSRSTCYGFTHPFEDIEVKINAPQLLEEALSRKRKPCMIGTGAMCDPYLPLEKELCLTRRCLTILDRYGFGATVQTKSTLVLRDLDLLCSINRKAKAIVQMTLTTFDEKLCKIVEPCVSTTKERFEALKSFQKEGIDTVVWLDPLLPFINDTYENVEGILSYCLEAGVKGIICFGMGLTLREGDREYYYAALDRHFPGLKDIYIKRYGLAYYLESPREKELMEFFHKKCEKYHIMDDVQEVFRFLHTLPDKQISFFDQEIE